MKLVQWPLMGGLLHLVQRGGDWAGPQPAQAARRGHGNMIVAFIEKKNPIFSLALKKRMVKYSYEVGF